jgi:hypothetical protein
MRLQILTAEATPAPEKLETSLKAGMVTKRHEFSERGEKAAFVVFEGEEQRPFWRRESGDIRFVFTDLSYHGALAVARQPNSFLDHTTMDSNGGEFLRYYREAYSRAHG